ncbi:MAG: MFS transporter [Actinomycetota bacterium]|nr:MFS transporter [Actinomycetota bacterium]
MPDLFDIEAPAKDRGQGPVRRVGWRFIALYAMAFMSTSLVLIAPLLVTLALKVNSLVGMKQAPSRLALVTAAGAMVAMVGNPFFGRMSDRTSSRWGMRRPWMVVGLVGGSLGILIVAWAPNIAVTLIGWCIAQLFFNALLAAQMAVLPDQVPVAQRGLVSGILGVCLPVASVCAAYLVTLFTGHQIAMFLAPCAVGGLFIVAFAVVLKDRRLDQADKPPWSMRETLATFYVNPRKNADFAWAFVGRFLFVLAYAFLITYQTYYLLRKLGSHESDVPHQIFVGVLAQSVVLIAASLLSGRVSDRTGRRKVFVVTASLVYGGPCSCSLSPATSTATSSAWRSAVWASACTSPSTSRSSPTCSPTRTTPARTSGCSTSPAPFRSPSPLPRAGHPGRQ